MKNWLTSTGLHSVIFQKIRVFTVIAKFQLLQKLKLYICPFLFSPSVVLKYFVILSLLPPPPPARIYGFALCVGTDLKYVL
jgi:hypothetical protein